MLTSCQKTNQPNRGFTLIELLVVIAIIAMLVAILLPALKSARATARTVMCLTKIRTIGFAAELYRNDFKDWYPVNVLNVNSPYWPTTQDYRFEVQVGPYTGVSEDHFTQSNAKNPWLCTENPFVPGWSLSEIRTTGYSSVVGYRGNFYTTTHFGWSGGSPYRPPIKSVKAPISEVVIVLEVKGSTFNRTSSDLGRNAFLHQGGVNLYAMTDGHAESSKATSVTELEVDGMRLNPD